MRSRWLRLPSRLDQVSAFWRWFADARTAPDDDPTTDLAVAELDRRLAAIGCTEWEIGPGRNATWFLAISPGGDPERLDFTRETVRMAPEVPRWEFLSWRPRKEWNGKFEFLGGSDPIRIDTSSWRFVAYRFPDGWHDILILMGRAETVLSESERAVAARIAVEGQLGERALLATVRDIEVVDAWSEHEAVQARSLAALSTIQDLDEFEDESK